jgi:hypothetical protein
MRRKKTKNKDLMQSSSRRVKGKINARRYLPLNATCGMPKVVKHANYGACQRCNAMP